MQEKKETVDRFLTENFKRIQELRNLTSFNWQSIANEFKKQYLQSVDSEYLRNRFRALRKSTWIDEETSREIIEFRKQQAENVLQGNPTQNLKFQYISGKQDKSKGTSEFQFTASHIPTEAEIIEHFKIDTNKFTINQIWHKTTPSGKYSISVSLLAKKGNQTIELDEQFIQKLSTIKPIGIIDTKYKYEFNNKPNACLLIPKQDSHWNKKDINGNNSIEDRFAKFTKTLLTQLEKAQATNNIEKIIYIVGSDEFNSEYTNATTKGTPQENILSYQQSFEKVSEFTIEFIKLLKFYTPTVEIVLLNGNHDHNVSWHLANLLKHVFSKNSGITVDTDLVNTKVLEYASNLILVNHGDEMKPKELASKFPIIAKDKWSNFENYFVITGDKHHEVAHDFNGVMTYQVPQLSTAKSSWDDKKGHVCSKAESIVFLFEEDGLSNMLRKQIK